MENTKSKPKKKSVEIDLTRYFLYDQLFDHPTEYEFYKILRDDILGERFVAMVQIPLSSIIGVRRRKQWGWKAHFSKIARKRIDFLICQKEDLKPLLAIELDGSTHNNKSRQDRDTFVDNIFQSTNLPILHVRVQSSYDKKDVTMQIANKLGLVKR